MMERNERYINRELSWLAFNYRVLQEAQDARVPLLERLKFLAIYASNLDEYFRVRVATIKRLMHLKEKARKKLKEDPARVHDAILREVDRQQAEFGHIFRHEILPALEAHQVYLPNEKQLTPAQVEFVQHYFKSHVLPHLNPIRLDQKHGRLFLKDGVVYLGLTLTPDAAPDEPHFALMELPAYTLGRFVQLPDHEGRHFVMFLDDVVRVGLPQLFPEYRHVKAHAVKLSRDAELDLDEEDEVPESLLQKILKSVRKRAVGHPARLLYDPHMPPPLLHLIQDLTGVTYDELVAGSRYHNFRDLFQFPELNLPELLYERQPPLPHPVLEQTDKIMPLMAERDLIAHYPYQKFDYAVKLFLEAAKDPDVTAVYATMYRVAEKSAIGKALVKAARKGKQVTAVIELKARFDEASNAKWARKLVKAGANVIYGVPGLKVHTKLGLVTRTENGKPRHYAYLSSGNYNEVTARFYADHALFTTDIRLTREVEEVFNFFIDQKRKRSFRFKHLLVAPFNMRKRFNQLIDCEIEAARAGKPAYMILKMNALEDERMVEKLYEASQAGVKITLLVRGICVLRPGVPGLSENIEVRGIIDRYLEHARVYIFANGGAEKLYIASADWMTRNLTRRVEVAFPIYDENISRELRQFIDLQMADNQKSRDINNQYVGSASDMPVQAQQHFYDFLKEHAVQHGLPVEEPQEK